MKADMKFRVKNKEHSEAIQHALFKLGYSWGGAANTVSYTGANCLFAYKGTDLLYYAIDYSGEYFDEHKNPEYVLDESDGKLKPLSEVSAKPPIGLRPRKVVLQDRLVEILEAMHYYAIDGKTLPNEWVDELVDINEVLKDEK